MPSDDYRVLLARTQTVHRPVGPVVYDCVKVIVVRDGTTILFSQFGQKPVRPGDVILLGPNVLCGPEPEGHITVTTIYADIDYVIGQTFWPHAGILHDRLDAPVFLKETFTEPVQIIRLGEHHAGLLMPWLDELVTLSLDAGGALFHRMQALWFSVIDRIAPHIKVADRRISSSQRAHNRPVHPRVRRFAPARTEAVTLREAMESNLVEPWTLDQPAAMVHLSEEQLSRVFVNCVPTAVVEILVTGRPTASMNRSTSSPSPRTAIPSSSLMTWISELAPSALSMGLLVFGNFSGGKYFPDSVLRAASGSLVRHTAVACLNKGGGSRTSFPLPEQAGSIALQRLHLTCSTRLGPTGASLQWRHVCCVEDGSCAARGCSSRRRSDGSGRRLRVDCSGR